jgi:hypothetical protein
LPREAQFARSLCFIYLAVAHAVVVLLLLAGLVDLLDREVAVEPRHERLEVAHHLLVVGARVVHARLHQRVQRTVEVLRGHLPLEVHHEAVRLVPCDAQEPEVLLIRPLHGRVHHVLAHRAAL